MATETQQVGRFVGVDLGKTNLRATSYLLKGVGESEESVVLGEYAMPTPQTDAASIIAGCVDAIVRVSTGKGKIDAIGVGAFGLIDTSRGRVISSGHLPFWNDVLVASQIEEKTGVRCFLLNDVRAAALGLKSARCVKDECLALIQLGTSVGVAAYGRHLDDASQSPNFGQIAHLSTSHEASLGTVLGASGIHEALQARGLGDWTIERLFSAGMDDFQARRLLAEYVESLVGLAAQLAVLLVPDAIVIGGGIAASLGGLEPLLRGAFGGLLAGFVEPPSLEFDPSPAYGQLGAALWAKTCLPL